MNEQVKQLILGVGALSELWLVTYRNFLAQGLSHKEALEHTGEFIKVLISGFDKKGE